VADLVGPRQASDSLVARDGVKTEKLRTFAPDLKRVAPRSPSAALDDFPVWLHDCSTNAEQTSLAKSAPIASIARRTADFLRRLDCRRSCCETSLPLAPTITKSQRG
jgi:hypothetical protein